jgi:cytoplasmic FMR1 interacting protein
MNLCFDQLVFEVSQNIFTTYKAKATSILLDRKVKDVLGSSKSQRLDTVSERYVALLQQRHMKFLGRSIDFKHLIAQVGLAAMAGVEPLCG